MELSVRSYLNAGIAVTAASTIALTPVVVAPGAHQQISFPHVSASQVHLAATINPADVAALVANLNAAMGSVTSTVTSVVDVSGHTLTDALNSAAGLNNSLWDGLIAAAGANPTLGSVLIALKAASAGGLSELARSVGTAGDTITLTTGQVAGLLTSTVTGSLGTATQAVANVLNDPLSAASYLGLLTTPIGIVGLALGGGINVAASLTTNGVGLASTLVHGVSAQIGHALSLVNGLLGAGKTLTDVALIDGALTAVQGIVSAPVSAALAAVTGLTSAAADAATFTLGRVAGGAASVATTWLGNGSVPGALQNAIIAIGAAPLSPASYTNAISILVGAGAATVQSVIGTVSSFASLPFRVAADLTGTAADVINSFTGGLATAASGLLQAAGLPPFVSGLPYAVATAVSGAVNIAAFTTSAALDTIATAIDFGQAIGGILNSATAAPHAVTASAQDPAALPDAERHTTLVTLATAEDVTETPAPASSTASTAEPADSAAAADVVTSAAESATGATTNLDEPAPAEPTTDTAPRSPTATTNDSEASAAAPSAETSTDKRDPDSPSTASTGGAAGAAATAAESTATPTKKDAAPVGSPRAKSSTEAAGQAAAKTHARAVTDASQSDSYGRHASGTTASESSPSSVGRHRSDSPPSADSSATSGESSGATSGSPSSAAA
ncbi:hypothetical protein ACRDU6_00235 (plasmid) [Mycolicibacterium sp. ELW1]|uniref:hypothetical protein n=1 Tax=Mycobacteriaceae TaxID=1762 RepID=UPI0011F009A4|nr:hypothetical protein [Mycobacterium sp. ELW1]QEN17593.1 hypothetical protein D3H54_30445 [Mycobacterium sp. ELW1]